MTLMFTFRPKFYHFQFNFIPIQSCIYSKTFKILQTLVNCHRVGCHFLDSSNKCTEFKVVIIQPLFVTDKVIFRDADFRVTVTANLLLKLLRMS